MKKGASQGSTLLAIVGNAPAGLGYPQAVTTVDVLRESGAFRVVDFCSWESDQRDFWGIKTGSRIRILARVMVILVRSVISVLKLRFSGAVVSSENVVIYFPYPAIFSLLACSLLWRRNRPRLVCDAYISIFDAAVTDRAITNTGLLTKVLFKLEQKALAKADTVIVDTTKNEDRISELFGLPKERLISMPIAIPEKRLRRSVGKISDKPSPSSDLIFFGALSPLHGIDVVLKAFGLLKGRDRSLTIVGDGQSGHRVAEYMAAHSDACIRWIREWQSLESLSEIIAGSKIALGVFGGCGKASTVLPLKAYISLCLGKPFVTQKQFSVPGEAPAPPFVTCENSPQSLAESIEGLLENEEQVRYLSIASRRYFDRYLSNKVVLGSWQRLIEFSLLR